MDNIASSSTPKEHEGKPDVHKGDTKKNPKVSAKHLPEHDNDQVERGEGDGDGEVKTYYSKTSVWLMVLYSGLAIGSDG